MDKNQDYHVSSKHNEKASQSVLILIADHFNDLEFFYPYYRFNEAGFRVDVASPKGGAVKGQSGNELRTSQPVENIRVEDYDLLYLPGGKAPAALRKEEKVLKLVKNFVLTGKPLAAICHGAQILVSADLVKNLRLAAWPEIEKEIHEAGGIFVNAPLVEDGQFISSRWPGDLPLHVEAAIKALGAQKTGKRQTSAA